MRRARVPAGGRAGSPSEVACRRDRTTVVTPQPDGHPGQMGGGNPPEREQPGGMGGGRPPWREHEDAYLLGLRLGGRRVVVVGGGAVAARRVPRLLAAGADVMLISPAVTPALEEVAAQRRIDWQARECRAGDCAGAWLVVACAGPSPVNAAVADEAERNRVWCVRADDAAASTVWTPAGGRVGDASVGVLTGDPR